ncbi:unnamed protein product [Heligmosomoides polygyrus]|uniref:tRNA_edit domain-containing protein n=1 Tax=Heligmosomoides polygyrus TaxID=6339 RepID=A0A183GH21_HELPZ|nr:unnamed protein product [Heligmosomoides polygyrus]
MSRKDTGDSREELPFDEILEKFLESKMSEQHLTVSNIEDGSYLLKMNIGPFPPLTCLIAENDWAVMMQKVVATMQSSIGTTLGTNSHPSPKYTAEKAMGVREKGAHNRLLPEKAPITILNYATCDPDLYFFFSFPSTDPTVGLAK